MEIARGAGQHVELGRVRGKPAPTANRPGVVAVDHTTDARKTYRIDGKVDRVIWFSADAPDNSGRAEITLTDDPARGS